MQQGLFNKMEKINNAVVIGEVLQHSINCVVQCNILR